MATNKECRTLQRHWREAASERQAVPETAGEKDVAWFIMMFLNRGLERRVH